MISNLYLQRKCGGTEKCDHSCPALQSVEVPGAAIDQKSCVMLKKQAIHPQTPALDTS